MYLNADEDKKMKMKEKTSTLPRWKKEEFEEVEYEPRSIKDLLIEMKNISELIVDLAYSSLLFNNKEIAEEVRYLEARMDTLNYEIRLIAMMAARSKEDAERLISILQIAEAAETISNAAGDIIKILSIKLDHPILPRLIRESNETIRKFTVKSNSAAINKKLSYFRIPSETGVRIITIRRGKKWIYAPSKHEILKPNDIVIGIGPKEGLDRLGELLEGKREVL